MASRDIRLEARTPELFCFCYRDVDVEAMDFATVKRLRRHVREVIEDFRPDWVLVSDDKRRVLLEPAVSRAPARVILLVQTLFHLPFGPHATRHSKRQAALMRRARGLVAISEYLKAYLKMHGGLDASLVRLPVFGEGPFPLWGNFSEGFVTLVNPCVEKGLSIFLALATEFPQVEFAAVPTWGAEESVLKALAAAPNVTIKPAVDDIDELFKGTRVLLAPSLWPEAFGYVVTEAMLRGIPVIASDSGGLAEAKLGVDYVVPVRPAAWRDGRYLSPEQDIGPWSAALNTLLSDAETYRRCSEDSRRAALEFASQARVETFESYLHACAAL